MDPRQYTSVCVAEGSRVDLDWVEQESAIGTPNALTRQENALAAIAILSVSEKRDLRQDDLLPIQREAVESIARSDDDVLSPIELPGRWAVAHGSSQLR